MNKNMKAGFRMCSLLLFVAVYLVGVCVYLFGAYKSDLIIASFMVFALGGSLPTIVRTLKRELKDAGVG